MRILKLLLISSLLLAVFSCKKGKEPSITVLCEKKTQGEYVLKWEVYPESTDLLAEVFVSSDDHNFSLMTDHVCRSDDYISVINTQDTTNRLFFRLKIGATLSEIVSNRFFEMDSIQNFRDIGGYHTNDNRQLKWGMIYRSGSLAKATNRDMEELKKLHIKSVIDLQNRADILSNTLPDSIKEIDIPLKAKKLITIEEKIKEDRFYRGDAVLYMQDTYRDIVLNSTTELSEIFDLMCEEKNYPLVYSCFFGKDQSGLMTYFLLRALNVPSEVIDDDYMASNIVLDKKEVMGYLNVNEMSEQSQEALTLISNANLAYLKYALSCIRKKYGSVDEYMEKELNLTHEKKEKLKNILLYEDA